MKLPALIRGDTAAKLEKARAERDRVSGIVTELCAKFNSLDVASDDYGAASLTADAQISVHQKALATVDRQIAGLESKLAAEEAAEREKRRQQAIKIVEQMLPERIKIVGEIEAAAKLLPALFEKLEAWQLSFIKRYPAADLEYPYKHFMSDDWVRKFVSTALKSDDVLGAIDGLTEIEAGHHAALIADLRSNPALSASADKGETVESEAA